MERTWASELSTPGFEFWFGHLLVLDCEFTLPSFHPPSYKMDVTLNLLDGINGITRVKDLLQWLAGTHRKRHTC